MSTTTTSTATSTARLLALALALALLTALAPPAPAGAQDEPPEPPAAPDALLLSGIDPVDASIAWSQVTYTPLEGEVEAPPSEALLGRDDLFADNLAAGSLMGQAIAGGRPLYLTPTGSLDAAVLEEMQRVLPEGATVHVLGGEEAISPAVVAEVEAAGFTVNRFAGETRVETATEIAAAQDADTVLVVRAFPGSGGDDTQAFADSLGAGALAASNGWEILFTQTEVLTGSTADALEAGGYARAVVVGGTAAISDDVLDEVQAIVPGTERVAGDTRFATAVALAELREGPAGDIAILVDGQSDDAWSDGFPAANLAGLNGYPVVLSNQGAIPAETEAFLSGFGGADAQFADHLTDVVLICGTTVAEATCQAALDIVNGGEGGEVRPFPPTADEEPAIPTFTDAPELVAVEVGEPTADGDVRLRFTFDEQITGSAPVAACFHLYAFDLAAFPAADATADCTAAGGGHEGDANADPASADGVTATIPTDDATAVDVTFDVTEAELAAATLATVDRAAVTDDDDVPNLEGDLPLEAVLAGGVTAAPDLVEVGDVDPNADTVAFTFDEAVAAAAIDPDGFVLVTASGDRLVSDAAARSTAVGEEDVVVASFTSAANDDVAEGGAGPGIEPTTEGDLVRAGALAGAVAEDVAEDEDGATNPLQVVDLAAGGTTTDPDLTAITVDRTASTVTYRFDEAVDLVAACGSTLDPILGQPIPGTAAPETCVQVYDRSGVETDATSVARSSTNTDLVATFAAGALDDAVGASVDAGAVSAVQGEENATNEVGELPIEDVPVEPGATAGPDLVATAIVESDALGTETVVEYTFDEAVVVTEGDPVGGGAVGPDASRFFVYAADGTPTRGATAEVDPDDPTTVRVVFDENEQVLAAAVTATVNDGAVVDADGDANPEGGGDPLAV
jgi:putative cell wall-binding protein